MLVNKHHPDQSRPQARLWTIRYVCAFRDFSRINYFRELNIKLADELHYRAEKAQVAKPRKGATMNKFVKGMKEYINNMAICWRVQYKILKFGVTNGSVL